MSSIIPFSFAHNQVRVITDETGEPLFVGKDVALVLGYADHTNAIKQHCRGVVKRHPIMDSLGRAQQVRVLTESDVLRLIISSKLPGAVAFERWVFEEVLPAIRKTGSYAMQTPSVPGDLYARALKAEKDEAASMALASVAGKALSLRRKEKRVLAQIVGLLREEVQLKLTLASIDGGVK